MRSNQEWAVDFACDALATGRGIRILAIVDAFTREYSFFAFRQGAKTMVPSGPSFRPCPEEHLPESGRCRRWLSLFSTCPKRKKPMYRLSGDQKGKLAYSVPASCAEDELSERTQR